MSNEPKDRVEVSANFSGTVEVCVRVGQEIHAGGRLVVIEGDNEIETLRARARSRVTEIRIQQGADAEKDALLMVLKELPSG